MSNDLENIDDHRAWACECGSVHFHLLRSGKAECSNCQIRHNPANKRIDSIRMEVHDLAVFLWRTHYQKTAPNWKPKKDAIGLLLQVDNMVCGLVRLDDINLWELFWRKVYSKLTKGEK